MHSANEIAYGLAEHTSGSLDAFVELMNQRAKELGAINTHFTNASGLHDENHYTTAYDMAMIARGCYNNTTFVNINSFLQLMKYHLLTTELLRYLVIWMLDDTCYEYYGGKRFIRAKLKRILLTLAEKGNTLLCGMTIACNAVKMNVLKIREHFLNGDLTTSVKLLPRQAQ